MKKLGIGSRLLAALLALTMVVSMLPVSVFAADGDIHNGSTGLTADGIDPLDTISWPIKIYDYLNDGLLFEYASAQDSSMTNLGGDAYGGGAKMPGDISYDGKLLGSDFTVNSSATSEYYDSESYDHWLWAKSNYDATYAQQGSATAGAFKFLRLQPWRTTTDMPAIVISDFTNDQYKYLSGTTSYPRDRVRYAVLVYKTNVANLELTMGMSTNLTGDYTVKDYNGNSAAGPDGNYVNFDLVASKYLTASESWNYIVVDMNAGPVADVWDSITKAYQIILDTNMTNSSQHLDLSHIAYFSDEAEATRFGEAAMAFSNNPGEFLPDQTYTVNGTTYSKHWNMGNNTAFTMLFASDGGGWNEANSTASVSGLKGGSNDWLNGYYSYQIGYNTTGGSFAGAVNDYRTKAEGMGYPVPDDVFYFNGADDLSTYDFGYTLYNDLTDGLMTAGLLQNDLIEVTGVDKEVYRIPEYKQSTMEYIAYMLRSSLPIGQKDDYGNYNYNFVQGSVSSQFMVNGQKVDLATALRAALKMTAATDNCGNYTVPAAANSGSYAATLAKTEGEKNLLIGPYDSVKGNINTFYDAAYYLLHNLFVDDSYNQLQDDYNYLVLNKATMDSDDPDMDGKQAFVFDAGFTTGNGETASGSVSSVKYDRNTGTISLTSVGGKDQIVYNSTAETTRNPFLPVTHAEGDYGANGTPYFRDDGARTYADYGDTYVNRNYNYVMQANAEFIYHYQDGLFFEFQGDDDVYLFVNDELVLDIGAAHSITSVKLAMNDYVLAAQEKLAPFKQNYGYRAGMSDEKFEEVLTKAVAGGTITEAQKDEYRRWHHLNLVDGESYSIDFYYMERHGWGANMRVATNIVMTDPTMITEKKAYQDGAEINYGGIVDENKLIEYSFSMTNEGFNKLFNLNFNDYDIGLSLTPENGLSFNKEGINGVTVSDARGQTLEASDLIVQVDGFLDEDKTQPVSLSVRFDGQDPNGELKQFLTDLTSNDGTDEEESDSLFAGTGLWRHATVTIRGIYYKMTAEQIADEQFNNVVFTTANPAVDSDIVLNSEDTHQVRLIGEAQHIYQWAEHEVYFTREDVANWLGGTIKVGSNTYSANEILLTTCRKDGMSYDYPDILVTDNKSLTVNYLEPGTQLTFLKVLRDTNGDGKPDDIDSDGTVEESDYLTVLPLAVYVTDLEDDVVVLDYGLKAELTGKDGITANDYITVPNLSTNYTIMGMAQTAPSYLKDTANTANNNYNRISFAPVSGTSIAFSDGTYDYTQETGDDKLYFTPTNFMDDEYIIYLAVTIHETDKTPSAVGTTNASSSGAYSIDITKEVQMYQKITVLPATVMYYEDDFAGLSYVDKTQGVYDHEGLGSSSVLQGVDQSVNYGADQVYQTNDNAQFSGSSMSTINITKNEKVAEFTFKGTGFEIISRTNAFDSASFVISVKQNGQEVRKLPVITEFSNTDSSVCKHTGHNTSGHCTLCGTYVGHVYYNDVCVKCNAQRVDYYLVGYINEADYGCETDYQNMGQYKFADGKLTATFKADGYVYVKTTGNANWFMTDGYPGTGVKSAFLYNTTMGIDANKLHVPGGVELTFTLVENSDGTLTLSYTTADDDVDDVDKTVYFNNTDGWTDVYAYYWSVSNATMVNWPGTKMTNVEGSIYQMTLPADAEYVIFNNNGGTQSADLTVPANNMVYSFSGFNKGWSAYNPGKTTLHFDNTASSWSKVYAYYWSEENETMVAWPGDEMTAGSNGIYTAVIPSDATQVIFNNGSGSQTADLDVLVDGDTFVYGSGWSSQGGVGADGRTVYFKNTDNWSKVNVYYWDAVNGGNLVAWPGDSMEHVEGQIFGGTVPAEATHLIFNDGTNQTLNIELDADLNLFVYDKAAADAPLVGSWGVYAGAEAAAVTAEAGAAARASTRTVYVDSDTGWTSVYAYYWSDSNNSMTTWPGVAMTPVEGNRYSVAVPADATYIIFTNNAGSQTADLTLSADMDLYTVSSNTWSSTGSSGDSGSTDTGTTRTVYLDSDTGWTAVNAYYWSDSNNSMTTWPGVAMTPVEGNRYSVTIPADATYIIFNDGGGNQTADLSMSADKDLYTLSSNTWGSTGSSGGTGNEGDTTVRTLYYENGNDWSTVNVYYWSDSNSAMVTWPGVPMTLVEGKIYSCEIPEGAQYVKFNDGTNGTADLTIPTDGGNYYDYADPTCGNWEQYDAKRVLYFDLNDAGWSSVYAYYWSAADNTMSTWPGTAMTLVEGTLYSVTVPMEAELLIFNDNGGNQTEDLSITDAYDLYTYQSGSWSSTTRTIYFEGNGTGSVRLTYWSDTMQESRKIMTLVKDQIYSCEIPMEAKYVRFEDGDTVSADIILSDDHDLYTADGWTVFDPSAQYRPVVYFENTQGWENVHVYYWSDTNSGMTAWPGAAMTFVDGKTYMANIPADATKVIFNNVKDGNAVAQTGDLTLTEDNDLFTLNADNLEGTWSKYQKPETDAIHQVPALRVDGLTLGEYTVEIWGMPTYTDDIDWSKIAAETDTAKREALLQSYVKTTYLYLDGIRIYQPMGQTNGNYNANENGASFKELRNLILDGHAAVAQYNDGTKTYSGNVSWTENRNGTGGDLETEYIGNQLSGIDDYLLIGPNNETYLNGNAQTQAVIFYVTETEGDNHALQIGARGIDAGLFLGSTASGVNATLYHGVRMENPDGTVGYGWRPMDTVLSGTEQYYTIDYSDCPYLLGDDGAKIYQVALFVRSGMISFTNVKFLGLNLETTDLGDATKLKLNNGILYQPASGTGSGTTGGTEGSEQSDASAMFENLTSVSSQMAATEQLDASAEQEYIKLEYPTLSFEEQVYYNIYTSLSGLEEEPVEMGLMVFDSLMEDGTVHDAQLIIPGAVQENGKFVVRSQGIAAKDLADQMYFKVYAQLSDGRYVYSKAADYSAMDYAQAILTGDFSTEMKALVVAMVNYAAAAQDYFGELSFITNLLSDELKGLVTDYSAELLSDVVKADDAKAGIFAATATGFAKKYPTVSFEDAFAINYYFTPSTTVQGDMKLYYWTAEDYQNADVLTADNATGTIVMTPGAEYSATVEDIAAKELDSTVYVAAVYNCNGITYSSGVLAYSLASYCESQAAGDSAVSGFAAATAVYGYYAKQFFG